MWSPAYNHTFKLIENQHRNEADNSLYLKITWAWIAVNCLKMTNKNSG